MFSKSKDATASAQSTGDLRVLGKIRELDGEQESLEYVLSRMRFKYKSDAWAKPAEIPPEP